MILLVDSDAAYLVILNAKSRIAGYFQLNYYPQQVLYLLINGTILVKCQALKHVFSLVAEVETIEIFHNVQVAVLILYILEKLWHPQPLTSIKTNNSTAYSFTNSNIY